MILKPYDMSLDLELDAVDLLINAVNHIKSTEGDNAENLLLSLGFQHRQLAMLDIISYIGDNVLPEEEENFKYVNGWSYINGEIVWELSEEGAEWIFSDQYEDDNGCYITEKVPFKNFSHYYHINSECSLKFIGYAWYSKSDNYISEFFDENCCFEWLVGNPVEVIDPDIITDAIVYSVNEDDEESRVFLKISEFAQNKHHFDVHNAHNTIYCVELKDKSGETKYILNCSDCYKVFSFIFSREEN